LEEMGEVRRPRDLVEQKLRRRGRRWGKRREPWRKMAPAYYGEGLSKKIEVGEKTLHDSRR